MNAAHVGARPDLIVAIVPAPLSQTLTEPDSAARIHV